MLLDQIRIRQAGDDVEIHVPFQEADAWHTHFRALGIDTTVCLDPAEQQACLRLRGVREADVAPMMASRQT